MKILKNACKHDISRWVNVRDLILTMWIAHTEYMIPIVFGGGQRSFGVIRGQKVKTMLTLYLKKGNSGVSNT